MKTSNAGTYKKILLYTVLAFITLLLIFPLALKKYLATPHAAAQVSRMLSGNLGQPVVVNSIDISDGTLRLKGLSLANPAGFPSSKLLAADSIAIKPLWLELLSGNRIFDSIAVAGVTVELHRNSSGAWNFDGLQRRLSSSKPSSAEVLIRQLTITKAAVRVNGQGIGGLALNISNLATKGSGRSGFKLEFDDPGRNHYALSGKMLLGSDPELEMSLSSPFISLKSLPQVLKVESAYLPERGKADLLLSVDLRKGVVRGGGKLNFSSAVMPAAGRGGIFSGNLSLAGSYDLRKDSLALDQLTLHLNKLLAVRASGSVRELKRARHFLIDVATDEIDIALLAPLIPELERRKLIIGGKLEKGFLHLAGNAAAGIAAASGKLGFSHVMLRQDKRLYFDDLNVTAALSGTGNSLTVTGKATQAKSAGEPLLESVDAPFKVTSNRHFANFKVQLPALNARAQDMAVSGSLSYAGGSGLIENAKVKARDFSASLGRFSARIPVKQVSSKTVRYPLIADFSRCDISRGDASVKKLSGSIRGAYAWNPNGKWLEGTAELSAEKAAWQGKESAAPVVRVLFSESGGQADLKASLLGGTVTGGALFNPFALQEKVAFNIRAKGIQLAGVNKYAGLKGDTALSAGALDAGCTGGYERSAGLVCHVEANGHDMAVTGRGGKTLLSAAGIRLNADLSGKRLVVNEALLTSGKYVSVRAAGTLENVFPPDRQGRINFTVPATSLAAVADSFINVLPRSIQEATVAGNVAAAGAVSLQGGRILVDGAVTLDNINIEAPTENIKVSGIIGVLPLSLDLAGKAVVTPPASTRFSRQNYAALMDQLRRTTEKGESITIGSSSFGGLSMDSTKLRLRAARGVTEIISLESLLYGGVLLGKGFIAAQNGLFYRGDLLFNDLSLVRLCKAFPAITGYMSGKIDGILSVQSEGKKLADISGFAEFWARETAGEKMLVSKEFLQRLSGKKLSGFFFSSDRVYDHAGLTAALENGFLSFDALDISHTNFLGVRDLSVTIAPGQNRIAIDHLLNSIKEATVRGKSSAGGAGKDAPVAAPPATEFKWAE
ncbi:MAG: hypothetical protein A2X82_12945 [Geobacteraceae bacterium GWC2_55_20]|nr:MAG: hypothetical protein A2X82_12945 [Geobacteraceae bacterium GWC2_55_20]HCE68813.1 hypothetical protein [Geobacter sp.]